MKNTTLVRIEKTHKVRKNQRVLIEDFLLKNRDDAFKNMTMVDIEKFDGRSRYKRLIKSEGTMVGAVKKMTRREQQNLKQHPAFVTPCLNLKRMLQRDLNEWINTSSSLRLKVIGNQMKHIFKDAKRIKLEPVKLNIKPHPLNMTFPKKAWSMGDKREMYQKNSFSIA